MARWSSKPTESIATPSTRRASCCRSLHRGGEPMHSAAMLLGIVVVAIALSPSADAQEEENEQGKPIPLTSAKNKVGAFTVTLTERSPLSSPAEIAKRLRIKPEQLGRSKDYDLAKAPF